MHETSTAAWLDAFFSVVYASWPVDASFIGVHEYDWRLPDYSENGAGDTYARLGDLLGRAVTLGPASRMEAIDRRLAEAVLRLRMMEYESAHFHRGNPSIYTGEAIFGLLALLSTDYAPLRLRLDAAAARLELVPALLRQARAAVRLAPLEWTERALRECRAARVLLTRGLDRLLGEHGETHAAVRRAAHAALRGFEEYGAWLDAELRHRTRPDAGIGADAFAMVLREAHCLEETADEIAARAELEMARLAARLQQEARDLGEATVAGVLARLAAAHPPVDQYYARFAQTWETMRDVAEAAELLTWPNFPIRYVARPAWVGEAADDLYYLSYRAPAVYARPEVHEYQVVPVGPEDPPQRQQELLRAMNDAVIKLNHVVHHGGLGHHVQNWYAYRSGSRIGQVAAVDCASRIAMTCGGTMAEGWACYATDLMAEVGALTALESFANRHAWLRMCARAVVDVRLHQNRFTLGEAAAYYAERASMAPTAARVEVVRNSMFPGAAMIYFAGADAIHRLRGEVQAWRGGSFTLRGFHDEFLSYGSIPVALIAAEMTSDEVHAV